MLSAHRFCVGRSRGQGITIGELDWYCGPSASINTPAPHFFTHGGSPGVISLEDWAEIRCLHRCEEMPLRPIARRLGVGRNTLRRASAAEGPEVRAMLATWRRCLFV